MPNSLVYILFAFISTIARAAVPQVKLDQTTVSGRDVLDGVQFFGGIPYAEPPLGPLRLRKPVLKTRLETSVFNASEYGKACPQNMADPHTLSEDCLTISVLRPRELHGHDRLPVLFWTHGGGWVVGSSREFDGSDIVAHSIARGTPIIYVNFNYRLGPLGFPLGQEADDHRVLNLALHDQRTALEWVQANIHFFGGDKRKVTVFGESAGAMMTGVQYLNSEFKSLARAAIFESGSANSLPTFPAARNEAVWKDFVGKVPSCAAVAGSGKTLTCLRNATGEEIRAAVLQSTSLEAFPWTPTLDLRKEDTLFPDYPSKLFAKGRFARLPFIAGNNLDEGTYFSIQQPSLTEAEMKALVVAQHLPATTSQQVLESVVGHLLNFYPDKPSVGSPYSTGDELFGLPRSFKRYASLVGDLVYVATRRQWTQAAVRFGVKSYAYHFTQPQPTVLPQFGVAHASEIPFVFGQVSANDTSGQTLSTVMMDYWISFAVSLSPNDGNGVERPFWPQYTQRGQDIMQLQGANTSVVKDDFRKDQIAYIIEHAYALRR